jgi:hypothetical protein
LRYITGAAAILRLYIVVQSVSRMYSPDSPMLRVMTHFFDLRLTTGVFVRWALQYHKFKILMPTFVGMWALLALMVAFAENLTFGTSMYFVLTTMTTVGYGKRLCDPLRGREAPL